MKNPRNMIDEYNDLEIKVEKPNHYYARLLLEDYAGQVSELTALTQYFNHEGVLFKKYPQISNVLNEIGLKEVLHLNILSKLIYLLGVNPKYRVIREDSFRVWWSPTYVEYEEDLLKIIEINIEGEKNAIRQYQNHLVHINDKYITDLLKQIILDEKGHIKKLTEIQNNIKNGISYDLNDSGEKSNFSNKNIIKRQEFTLEEIKQKYNGKDGNPSYVVVDGIVFDVTNIDEWSNGSHHGLSVGEEHTDSFYSCHGQKIDMLKKKLPIVGYLKNNIEANI